MSWTRGGAAAVGLAAAAGLLAPTTGRAQLEISPVVGLYAPLGALIREGSPNSPGFLEKRQETTFFLSARGLFWATKRLGVAANVTYSPAAVAVSDSFGTRDVSGGVLLADARVIVPFTPVKARWSANLGAGAGIVSRTGTVWGYRSGATAPAFVAALGVGTPIYALGVRKPYPPPRVVFRWELADYISRAQFDSGLPTETTARWHHDLTVSFMFALSFSRR